MCSKEIKLLDALKDLGIRKCTIHTDEKGFKAVEKQIDLSVKDLDLPVGKRLSKKYDLAVMSRGMTVDFKKYK